MEEKRELLVASIEEEEPPVLTTWIPECDFEIEPNKTEEPDAQPDIHKVWIRTSDNSARNVKPGATKLQRKSLKLSVADLKNKIKSKFEEQLEMGISDSVTKVKSNTGKFLWNSLELSISSSVSNKRLTFDKLQGNSTELSKRCLKVSEQWPKSISHLKSISRTVVRKPAPVIVFPCSVCTKTFKFKSALTRHMFTHFGEETIKCDECQRSIRKGNLLRHMIAHKSEKSLECPECSKKFKHKMNMESHAKSHRTKGAGDLFTCEECNKKYMHRTSLIKHIRSHQSNMPKNSKPFSCERCDKTYRDEMSLIYHVKTHTRATPFSCHVCSETLILNENLIKPFRIHTGDKTV